MPKSVKVYLVFNLLNKSVVMLDSEKFSREQVDKYAENLRLATGVDIFSRTMWVNEKTYSEFIGGKERQLLTCDDNLGQFHAESLVNNKKEYEKFMSRLAALRWADRESNPNLS